VRAEVSATWKISAPYALPATRMKLTDCGFVYGSWPVNAKILRFDQDDESRFRVTRTINLLSRLQSLGLP
jgi:hypothetical protein